MTPEVATQNQAVLELRGKIATNPALAQPILKILEQAGGDVERLRSLDLSALKMPKEALPKVESSTGQSLSANNLIAGREITLRGSPALEMHILVRGQIVRAVLSETSFGKTRLDQCSFAQSLGGRLATREESLTVVRNLLKKEVNGTLNEAEGKLLKIYRDKFVRDSVGGSIDAGRRVYECRELFGYGFPNSGALVVIPIDESKKLD